MGRHICNAHCLEAASFKQQQQQQQSYEYSNKTYSSRKGQFVAYKCVKLPINSTNVIMFVHIDIDLVCLKYKFGMYWNFFNHRFALHLKQRNTIKEVTTVSFCYVCIWMIYL